MTGCVPALQPQSPGILKPFLPPETNFSWYALYARSRHEKKLHELLTRKGIESFLPLRHFQRRWSDRRKEITEPLFKGYLFVRIPFSDRVDVLKTPGAVRFVGPSPLMPVAVPERDLESIRTFLNHNISIDPFPYLKEGTRVYVRSGPFKGAEGYVVQRDKQCRLVISLDLLMQSVSVQVPADCVEVL